MSDDEEFMLDSGEEDYDFDYESDEAGSEGDADLENQYYNAKGLKESDPTAAIKGFQEVIDNEPTKGEWGFKAHKQTLKVLFKQGRFSDMHATYRSLLTYIKSAVTRNYSEKSINSILDYVSAASDSDLLLQFYETTLEALQEAKNDRLWFKTNLKLGKMFLDREDYGKLAKTLKELHHACQTDEGEDDQSKGTQLLEIYALEIQMYTAQKETKKLKSLYEKSLRVKAAIPHPYIMGIVRECGGKMHLVEEQWAKAYEDFFEAFKNYDESGSAKKVTCLKYLVLANMLMKSNVDPFDAQESKPYKNDPQIIALTDLVSAYQTNDIRRFERILKTNRKAIMDDPFIREYIQDLLKNIRTEVLIKLIKPYSRVRIPFISEQLKIPEADVESLLVSCILDKSIDGRIDQIDRVVVLDPQQGGTEKYRSMDKWATQLGHLSASILSQLT